MSVEERFWAKVDKAGPNDCWLWTASLRPNGYGQFNNKGLTERYAHRIAYQLALGPIPEGLEIDHLCRVRRCVNPAHLEAVTHAENNRRGPTISTLNAAKTQCPAGHPYSGANLYRHASGYRKCRACGREAKRRGKAAA